MGSYTSTKKKESEKRMKCKRSIVLLTLALTLVLVPVSLAQAMKPLRFEVSGALATSFFGWEGTIDSGPLEGKTMIWRFTSNEVKGQAGLFKEIWEIYDGDTLLIAGFDEGVTRLKTGKFTGNGRVTYATTEWEHLIGRKEHISGTGDFTTWTFTGTVQIN